MKMQRALLTAGAVGTAFLMAACQDATAPGVTGPSDGPSYARSAQAQDRLEQLFQQASPEVMDLPGTVFADNDERAGKLVFGIEHMGHARAVQNRLRALGVDEGDYAIQLTPAIHNVATLRDAFRPTQAGIQINFTQYVCTLGFNVDYGTTQSFITNSHCTATQGGVENTEYWQPLKSSHPTSIAIEVQDPTYQKNIPGCSRGKKCRYSDASRATYRNGTQSERGLIAQTTGVNTGSLTVSSSSPTFTVTSQDASTKTFATGTVVNKVGRTTGWTQGAVTQSCVTTNVSGSTIQLICQTFVQNPQGATVVSGGDSGSGVFRITGTNAVQLVGLLWGGSSDNKLFVFSPLSQVVQELGSFNAVR